MPSPPPNNITISITITLWKNVPTIYTNITIIIIINIFSPEFGSVSITITIVIFLSHFYYVIINFIGIEKIIIHCYENKRFNYGLNTCYIYLFIYYYY